MIDFGNGADDVMIWVTDASKHNKIYDTELDRIRELLQMPFQGLVGKRGSNFSRSVAAIRDLSLEVRKGDTLGVVE